jgi:DNA processing protein
MLEAVLRLTYCRGIGPRLGRMLLSRFPDPGLLFSTPPQELGIPERAARLLGDPAALEQARREIGEARGRGYRLVVLGSPPYPPLLEQIPDPPLVLRAWGDLPGPKDALFAIVGTRRPTAYGRRQAALFSRDLAGAGVTVVSGLARGIDGIAHEEALATGGRTMAVLGSGLARLYPPEHADLARRIASRGAVLSELPLDEPPRSHHFPRRNRIIAGLSLGVLVIEGGLRSGALITAACAAEQGRQVFAVPGPVDSPAAEGTNALLRDGAGLVATTQDLLGELAAAAPLLAAPPARPRLPALGPGEGRVLAALPPGPVDAEQTAEKLALPLGEVLAALTSLEVKGYLRRFGDSLERL